VKPDQVDLAAYPVMTVLVIVLAAIAAIADENRIAAALAAIAIRRDDRLGVPGAVRSDVCERGIEAIDDANDQILALDRQNLTAPPEERLGSAALAQFVEVPPAH
jgi:hypothetical protein